MDNTFYGLYTLSDAVHTLSALYALHDHIFIIFSYKSFHEYQRLSAFIIFVIRDCDLAVPQENKILGTRPSSRCLEDAVNIDVKGR